MCGRKTLLEPGDVTGAVRAADDLQDARREIFARVAWLRFSLRPTGGLAVLDKFIDRLRVGTSLLAPQSRELCFTQGDWISWCVHVQGLARRRRRLGMMRWRGARHHDLLSRPCYGPSGISFHSSLYSDPLFGRTCVAVQLTSKLASRFPSWSRK